MLGQLGVRDHLLTGLAGIPPAQLGYWLPPRIAQSWGGRLASPWPCCSFPLNIGQLCTPPHYLSFPLISATNKEVGSEGLKPQNCSMHWSSPPSPPPPETMRREVGQVEFQLILPLLPPGASWGGFSAATPEVGGGLCRERGAWPALLQSTLSQHLSVAWWTWKFSSPAGLNDTRDGEKVNYLLAPTYTTLFHFIDAK